MTPLRSLAFLFSLWITPAFGGFSVYQDGDIIFQESQSSQAKAIQEATGSQWSHVGILFSNRGQWYVLEAVQPVRMATLNSFLSRGKDRKFKVLRLPGLTELQKSALRAHGSSFLGRNYDIYFEWSNDLIYCSELVYKTFLDTTGVEVGKVQKFRELRLDGPYAKVLTRRRLQDTGRSLNLDEPIVTPATQAEDPKLKLVRKSE